MESIKIMGVPAITRTENLEYPHLLQYPEIMEILDEVYQVYGQFSRLEIKEYDT